MNAIVKFLFCLLLCLGGGLLTGLATESGIGEWYSQLPKPPGTPPNFIFPIVWSLIYTLMAVSLTLLWISPTKDKGLAASLFFLQLCLNFIWSWIFFAYQSPGLALVDILLLWVVLVATIFAFWRHSRIGSLLFLPYVIWLSYAVYLNASIWTLME